MSEKKWQNMIDLDGLKNQQQKTQALKLIWEIKNASSFSRPFFFLLQMWQDEDAYHTHIEGNG